MKHITLVVTLTISFMLGLLLHTGNEKIRTVQLATPSLYSSPPPCSPACAFLDSMTLITIYNSTGGSGWTNPWFTSDPVCMWPGVTLNANGNVTSLVLNNNGLTGNIPADISNIAATLSVLQVDNNCLEGPITPEIGDCLNLQTLFLDNNKLTGPIPESFGQLTSLLTLFLDNNQLTGTVPDTFLNMNNLQSLDIFNNCFDSIPDLSAMLSLQPNKFRVQNNKLTFDDLLPTEVEIGTFYEPQDSFGLPITVCLPTGVDTFIDLGIDAGLTTNTYDWFTNGSSTATTTTNKLFFTPITWNDAGSYTVNVTNSIMTDLTLHGRPIILKVVCGQSVGRIEQTLCSGSGDNVVVDGVVFDEDDPSGMVDVDDLDIYGCDSIVIVDLTYYTSPPVMIDTVLCPGESIIVNGTEYDEDLPSGTETLGGDAFYSCDSSVIIDISYYPEAIEILNPTICLGDSLEVNGTFYHFGNPTGTETLAGDAQHGCDSIIEIDLEFFTEALAVFDDVLCSGNSITIAGILFDEDNPSDTLILEYMSMVNGCDSVIHVDLTFGSGVIITMADLLCDGGSIQVNGNTYDQDTPSGTEEIPSSNAFECDTTIIIDLEFYVPDTGFYDPAVCQGGSITFNGTVFDNSNPDGFETIASELYPQCDSTVFVEVVFLSGASSTIDTTLCPGESITVNGTEYDSGMPSGSETFTGMGFCDSVVFVNVTFFDEAITVIDSTLCPDGFIIVEGTTCDIGNPSETFVLNGQSFNGCDSTVIVDLEFFPDAINNIDTTLCIGESVIIEGVAYDETNMSGSFTSSDPGFHGCDSTIVITVDFFPVSENTIEETLCFGGSLTINNTDYDADNPTDTIVLSGASFHDCDSTIYVYLDFHPEATGSLDTTLCPGESITINGTIYDETTTDGVETLSMGSFYQCDSILTVHVEFFNPAASAIDTMLCFGDEITIGGMVFNAATPSDILVLPAASYNNCDSTIVVNVTFFPEATALFNSTLCFGQTLEVNFVTYTETMPNGLDTIFGGSFYGCDSIIVVDLTYNNAVQVTIDDDLCLGEFIIVNGTEYNELMPNGTETFMGGSVSGCDSIVVIDLQYPPGPAESTIDGSYCEDVFFIVNGEVYDFGNPVGTETLTGASSFGCDSTVTIDLEFFDPALYELDTMLCTGNFIIVDGVTYDESNTEGFETFTGGSFHGCDSTIHVIVSFFAAAINDFDPTWCEGQMINLEGTVYDSNNPTDTLTLMGQSFHGCDSIIYINISFSDAVEVALDPKLCPGGEVIVYGTVYDEDNPMGSDTLVGGSFSGCDSIVHVDLDFYDLVDLTFDLEQILCPGEEVIVNDIIYDQDTPMGTETIVGGSYSGCDSIVNIDLDFHDEAILLYNETICMTDSVELNGVIYNFNNPTGNQILEDEGSFGCDSFIVVDLSFYPQAANVIDTMICDGGSIEVNGVVYDTPGIYHDVEEGASYLGCDSIFQITLNFFDPIDTSITAEICEGETYELNGNSYNTSGMYVDVFEGGSYTGCDSTVNLTLVVQTAELLGLADAGADIEICEETVALNGNTIAGTSGLWTSMDGASLSDPSQANGMASGLMGDMYSFVWTLSTGACLDYDSDTVTVFVAAQPEAIDDAYTAASGVTYLELLLVDNDNLNGVVDWTVDIPTPPAGIFADLGNGLFGFEADSILLGTMVTFDYLLCNESCSDCSTATVTITFDELPPVVPPEKPSDNFPNGITPNGDGTNDVFIIPLLEENSEEYLTRELIVFNRWGDVVFEQKPYANNWGGTNKSGQDLPEGTYYYVFRLDLSKGIIYKGDITILR